MATQVVDIRDVEHACKELHATMLRLAPQYGFDVREGMDVPWDDLPVEARRLFEESVREIALRGIIKLVQR